MLLLSGAALVFLFSPWVHYFEGRNLIYYQGFHSFRRALLFNWIWIVFLAALPPLRRYVKLFLFIQVFFLGFLGSELLYRASPFKVGPFLSPFSPYRFVLNHLDYFFLHRIYGAIPLAATIVFFLCQPKGSLSNRLRFGDWGNETRILGTRKPLHWRQVIGRFLLWLGIVLLVLILFSLHQNPASLFHSWAYAFFLLAVLLYAVFVAVMEETIFRGIFFPLFSSYWGDTAGNILQSFLFGLIHFMPGYPVVSAAKILLFTFLGWFFGRATRETEGLGASIFLHFCILFSLELRRLFLYFNP